MKKTSVNRLKWLIAALLAAVLLNMVLLLFSQRHIPDSTGDSPNDGRDQQIILAGDSQIPHITSPGGNSGSQDSQVPQITSPDSDSGSQDSQTGDSSLPPDSPAGDADLLVNESGDSGIPLTSSPGSDSGSQDSQTGDSSLPPDSPAGDADFPVNGSGDSGIPQITSPGGDSSSQDTQVPQITSPDSSSGVIASTEDSTDSRDALSLRDFLPPSVLELDDTVTLCLTGDLMCLAGQQYTAERPDGSHDYSGSFKLIQGIFADCDFVVGNLETILSESNPYSTKERLVNEQPNCNAPADYLGSLKAAGFTHLVTANNHSLDGGITGITETIAHLEEYGLPHTGTYRENDTGEHFLMMEQNGIRIALISFTELVNQRDTVTAGQLSKIIDCYGKKTAAGRIAKARAAGADFVIVYNHWGSENTHEVRDYQKQHAKDLADAGADLVIGSHPHCLQYEEMITASDGREVPCFYSLGNVVSSMTRDINHDTVLVLVTLKADVDNDTVSIYGITLVPCHVLQTLDGSWRVITPTAYAVTDEKTAAELAAAKDRISEIFPKYQLIVP